MTASQTWYLYIVRCNNGALYTGISTNVAKRFEAHQTGKGAKFLRGKMPLHLVFQCTVGTRSEALKLELQVKRMRKPDKENIIQKQTFKIKK